MGLPLLVGVCLAIVAWQAVRHPILRRLAARDATRRPGESVLVVLGSLLGTALITGSMIVGDTLDSSIKQTAYSQLGPIDEVVQVPDEDAARSLAAEIAAAGAPVDGVGYLLKTTAAIAAGEGDERRAEPEAQLLETDFDSMRGFGGDPDATGLEGPSPGAGEIYLGSDLAGRLDASVGQTVTLYLYGSELRLRTARVLPRLGVAGFWLDFGSESPNAFVAPGTIERAAASARRDAVPPQAMVLVSNRGGVEEGAARTAQVTEALEEIVGAGTGRVEPVKRERLDDAEVQGQEFGGLFIAIGSFAIVAGVLLLVNIFVMLAEERKSTLGMLRAVGMRRSHLVRAFVIEGTIYALIASIVGVVLGIGVGWAISVVAAGIFGRFQDFALELRFDMAGASLVAGFCAGLLISLLTIAGTSVRISRINIIRAIRDLPEPEVHSVRRRTRIAGIAASVLGASWFAASLFTDDGWAGLILGPVVAGFGLVPVLGQGTRRERVVMAMAGAGLAWGIFGDRLLGGRFFDNGDEFAFVTQGIMLTFCAVVLLSQAQEAAGMAVRRLAARNLPVRLSIAYPLARRFRTGLTLGMFALVIFTMTFVAVLSTVFGGQVDAAVRKEGGFDVLLTASPANPPAPAAIRSHPGVSEAASLLSGLGFFTAETVTEPEAWPVSGIDEDFVAGGPPELGEFSERFDDPAEVWDAVLDDPEAVVVPVWFLREGGGGPGAPLVELDEEVALTDPLTGRSVTRTVAGFIDNDYAFSGAYMSKASLQEALGDRVAPSRYYIEVAPDADEDEVAASLQGALIANGAEAQSFRTLIREFQGANLQFFQLMQAYLALGLVVGIAGLGVVMVRAVRDRRHEVGVLRSLGFVAGQVRTAFILESGFVALEGILVGAVLALITSSQMIATDSFGENLQMQIPWVQLGVVTLSALVASLLATSWPAQQASRIPPAEALRLAE